MKHSSKKGKMLKRMLAAGTTALVLCISLVALVACAPHENLPLGSGGSLSAENGAPEAMPVNWTINFDCAVCHVEEVSSATSGMHAQATAHQDLRCIDCHAQEATLTAVHDGITFADTPSTKAKHNTVEEQTCVACHGSLAQMAQKTSGSTALVDGNGLVVNPHKRPAGNTHTDNPATCTDCHNNHSESLGKDAMKYCALCHHRGVFQCGTCHELRTP
ncbi:MAG: cytochrome c3 family protein, partial [Coriobacteriales bacterium]|nr:cytochrome c3 family protein [Coriobacteriales bacterium]